MHGGKIRRELRGIELIEEWKLRWEERCWIQTITGSWHARIRIHTAHVIIKWRAMILLVIDRRILLGDREILGHHRGISGRPLLVVVGSASKRGRWLLRHDVKSEFKARSRYDSSCVECLILGIEAHYGV